MSRVKYSVYVDNSNKHSRMLVINIILLLSGKIANIVLIKIILYIIICKLTSKPKLNQPPYRP